MPPAGARRGGDWIAAMALLIIACAIVIPQWRGAAPPLLDIHARIVAGWEMANRAVLAGQLPLWNPLQFDGQPHLANPRTLALYPPHLLLRLLPFNWFFPGTLILHAWLAACGTYIAARAVAATRIAAVAMSVAVMVGAVLAHGADLTYEAGALGAALVPLVLASAIRSTQRDRVMPQPMLVATVTAGLLSVSTRSLCYVGGAVIAWYAFALLWRDVSPVRPRRLFAQLAILVVLAAGSSAVVGLPAAALQLSMLRTGGLSSDEPAEDSWHDQQPKPMRPAPPVAAVFAPLRGHRTIAACDRVVDAGQLAVLEIPGVGGYGGVLLADYARFTNMASGVYPEKMTRYQGLPRAGHPPTRADLVNLLGAEYLIACDPPEQPGWTLIATIAGGGIYRNPDAISRATWTCAPAPVGRQELEYRLTRDRYDRTLSLRKVGHLMNVRWVAGVSEEAQRQAERSLHLERDRFMGERTWRYQLMDTSPENTGAIVRHPLVEDTAGLDRSTFDVVTSDVSFNEPKSEWLLGASPCADTRPARIIEQDRPDAHAIAEVAAPRAGVVLFTDTYYPQRAAFVDGRRVVPLKVNFAFTAVPVPAGVHRVELAYASGVPIAGVVTSLLALVLWAAGEWRLP